MIRLRAVAALLLLTAAGTFAFWLAFFAAGDVVRARDTDVYLAFERSFPAADAWMAVASAAAAIGLLGRRAWATAAGVAAGSALVFLGLIDVTFDVEQGMYAQWSAAVAVEIAINVYCLVVGPFLMLWFWKNR